MAILIDSSVWIEYERQRLDLAAIMEARPAESFVTSPVVISELLHGAFRADTAERRRFRESFVAALVETLPVADINAEVAWQHARLWALLERQGQRIGGHDLWLAATALAYGHRIATANLREFARVPDLQVERWPSS